MKIRIIAIAIAIAMSLQACVFPKYGCKLKNKYGSCDSQVMAYRKSLQENLDDNSNFYLEKEKMVDSSNYPPIELDAVEEVMMDKSANLNVHKTWIAPSVDEKGSLIAGHYIEWN